MSNEFVYQGTELDAFSHATNWKTYWGSIVSRFLGKRILEVGAGAGATVRQLCGSSQQTWIALEPDAALAERMSLAKAEGSLPAALDVRVGTIAEISPAEQFDTILYIDVLEHIEDDRGELERAAERLTMGGHIVVLAPAHQSLYTAFDAAIGHFRRYNRKSLLDLTPAILQPKYSVYLDSVGLLASIGNRLVLKSATPTARQIALWDNVMVPASKLLDQITMNRIGKSLLVVWRKE
jgi:SAM-dependent methyltransferase